jgi:hypothetical protein
VSFLAELLPDEKRARGMGISSSMNLTAQGWEPRAGLLTEVASPSTELRVPGGDSALVGLWLGIPWVKAVCVRYSLIARREEGSWLPTDKKSPCSARTGYHWPVRAEFVFRLQTHELRRVRWLPLSRCPLVASG